MIYAVDSIRRRGGIDPVVQINYSEVLFLRSAMIKNSNLPGEPGIGVSLFGIEYESFKKRVECFALLVK